MKLSRVTKRHNIVLCLFTNICPESLQKATLEISYYTLILLCELVHKIVISGAFVMFWLTLNRVLYMIPYGTQ